MNMLGVPKYTVNTDERYPTLISRAHHDRVARRAHALDHYGAATEEQRQAVTSTRSRHPICARPRCLKRRSQLTTVGIKWPGPLPSKGDPRVARARGSKSLTLEGCGYQPEASKPAWREREPQTPSIYKDY
jgi:hypothetical protein